MLGCVLITGSAWAHAFPVRSSPQVGASLTHAPAAVTIWFDAELEPLFSRLTVTDAHERQVSTGPARVPAGHPRELTAQLAPLASGTYIVSWSVVATDGHHTEGRFRFVVR